MDNEVKEVPVEEIPVEETNDVADATVEPVEEVEEAEGTTFEVVCECAYLNVREAASTDADVVCRIKEKEVLIAEPFNEEWYHIFTKAGIEGYVMSKFVRKK